MLKRPRFLHVGAWLALALFAVAVTSSFAWQGGSRPRSQTRSAREVDEAAPVSPRSTNSRDTGRRSPARQPGRGAVRDVEGQFEDATDRNRGTDREAEEDLTIASTNGGVVESQFETVPGFNLERATSSGRAEETRLREMSRAERAGGAERFPDQSEELSPEEYARISALPSIEDVLVRKEVLRGLETVCDADDRVRVNATTQVPWSANCQLIIDMGDSGSARGTGWLLGPQIVITAGHCVFDPDSGEFFDSVEVIAGMNGPQRPFGSQRVARQKLRASEAWKQSGSMAADYGAIILDRPFESPSGVQPATFGVAVLSDLELESLNVNTAGYPGDRPLGQQWFNGGRIRSVSPTRLSYMIDTVGGQSGSAVWRRLANGQRQAIGIHNYGGCPNRCTRITSQVFSDLRAWRDESE